MAQYVATRAASKGQPVHATNLDVPARTGVEPQWNPTSAATAATTLQAVHAVLADVLGTVVLPDQPLMQVRDSMQT